ncbi:hypothetical protein SAMN05518672_1011352 [Chitinophaga sp. CF118]|uniref:hypothetical protein n=1 Tax=Chitinophaga sp. CF118 TaxID=1884367 RepID=UPI0008F1D53E|nr:hypothetical protein [Chitinophaga sp. CF118]SFD26570.1 hypothetical protein SAMN05518672_1011352 [Chitinophaga sp. CF118]
MRTPHLILFLFILTTVGCIKDEEPIPDYSVDQLYANSIADAMVADSSEIIDTLLPIIPTNSALQWKKIKGQSYVLMATFMRFPSSYPEGDSITTKWGESWLFIPSQMRNRLAFTASSDTIMRICQLLGLPPVNSSSNTHIAEVWVKAARLRRPAGSPDITTTTASAVLMSGVSASFRNWFNNYIVYAYYHSLQSGTDFHYPWTRFGYTYDWAPDAKEVGLSEYVLQSTSGCWVEKVRTAQEYFKN